MHFKIFFFFFSKDLPFPTELWEAATGSSPSRAGAATAARVGLQDATRHPGRERLLSAIPNNQHVRKPGKRLHGGEADDTGKPAQLQAAPMRTHTATHRWATAGMPSPRRLAVGPPGPSAGPGVCAGRPCKPSIA